MSPRVVANYDVIATLVREHAAETGTKPSYARLRAACNCSHAAVYDALRQLWREEPELAKLPFEPCRDFERKTGKHSGLCQPAVARRIVHLLTTDDGAAERMARLMGGYHRVSC